MKKISMNLLTALVMTVILQFWAVAADDYPFTANISGPADITEGSEVTYAVSVTNIDAGGGGLTAADMALSFDTDVFTYVSGSAAAVSPPAGWSEGINESSASSGSIYFSPSGTPPITDDNAIRYQLRFIVKSTDKESTELLLTRLTGMGIDDKIYIGTSAGLNIFIVPPLAISDQILGGSLKAGEFYSAAIVTTGGTGAKTFAITDGALPLGLSLNQTTGVVSGTPSAPNASPADITVLVKDEVETTGVTAVITVPSVLGHDISGQIKCYDATVETTVTLFKAGEDEAAYTISLDALDESGENTRNFSFKDVGYGVYDLAVTNSRHAGCTLHAIETNGTETVLDPITIYLVGDVNRNGRINSTDVLLTRRCIAGLETLDADRRVLADVNKNGTVNSTDVLMIRQYIAGLRDKDYEFIQ